jgi:hypothetical protein
MPPIRVEGRARGGSNSLSIYSLRGAGISAPRSFQRTYSGILCLLDKAVGGDNSTSFIVHNQFVNVYYVRWRGKAAAH